MALVLGAVAEFVFSVTIPFHEKVHRVFGHSRFAGIVDPVCAVGGEKRRVVQEAYGCGGRRDAGDLHEWVCGKGMG